MSAILRARRSGSHRAHASLLLCVIGALTASRAVAQGISHAGSAASAVQLPLSGRQAGGSVEVRQSAPPSAGSNTLNTSISIGGSAAGSVLDPSAPADAISLTLEDAVRRGLAYNLGAIGASNAERQAAAQRNAARSGLLPQISASVSENAAKVDLAAEGFSASAFGGVFSGFNFPTAVGPFHYYDLHGALQQDVLDLTAIYNYRSARQLSDAAALNTRDAREQVVLAVAGAYLQLLATSALLEQQQAEVRYAEASYKQAQTQANAGNKAPIDARRSLVELQTEKQRLSSEDGDFRKQKNTLARLIGLPLGIEITLTEKLPEVALAAPPLNDAIRQAFASRADLRAAEAQLRAAEAASKAAKAERLPTATVGGQYGLQGTNPDHGTTVFQAAATVNVPIFAGGRLQADTAQADSVVAQRRAELSDERGAVELDVRNAYIDLDVASRQVVTAASNRKLALETLQQSQDRFAVGVADSVEVVSSEQSLAAADHDYVSSLFSQSVARIALARAMGEAEKELPGLLKGTN